MRDLVLDAHGRAVQVDPIIPKLKLPGTKRLKLNWDEPLSNFAFKFNLRRHTTAALVRLRLGVTADRLRAVPVGRSFTVDVGPARHYSPQLGPSKGR